MPEKRRILERTKEAWDDATEKIGEAKEKARDTIQEHPFTSVIVAAAIGAVAGVAAAEFLRRMRRRRRE